MSNLNKQFKDFDITDFEIVEILPKGEETSPHRPFYGFNKKRKGEPHKPFPNHPVSNLSEIL